MSSCPNELVDEFIFRFFTQVIICGTHSTFVINRYSFCKTVIVFINKRTFVIVFTQQLVIVLT